jgi:hypothetical protein
VSCFVSAIDQAESLVMQSAKTDWYIALDWGRFGELLFRLLVGNHWWKCDE